MDLVIIALGAGCIWHGIQIVWVAPTASQLRSEKPPVVPGSPQAFQLFWLDQYAWIGIALSALGLVLVVLGAA
jgi:hypothetical protein